MIDFSRIAEAALAAADSLVPQWLPAGRKNGHEWLCGDLHGSPGESTSINLRTGRWADFAGDAKGGDLISLYAAIHQIEQLQAARDLGKLLGIEETPAEKPKRKGQQWTQVIPAPANVPPPPLRHFHYGDPEGRWCYEDAEGRVIGWIARFRKSEGGKEVMPCTWARNQETGEEAWKWLSFPKPRPLYGLPLLNSNSTARVSLVEGEKCADALRSIGALAVTWPGGSKAVKHTDWTPLKGRKVTIWPDADEPGHKAAHEIAEILHGQGCEVRLITPPEGKPDGWDCADAIAEGMSKDAIAELFKAASLYEPEPEPPPPTDTEPTGLDMPDEPLDQWPFQILGHNLGTFYYMSHASGQIVELGPKGHGKLDLLQLAPLDWWARNFPGKGDDEGASVNWLFAANALIQQAMRTIFNPSLIRGRGAWLDGDTVLYHSGDALHVGGMPHSLSSWQSSYVYQRGITIAVDSIPPADAKSASRLLELTGMLNLRNPLDSKLLAGWLVCAPICGVLDWRPHIWITGPSGSGKTWLIENIIHRLLGNMALYVQSVTTEAGIRQHLGCDALPVMFDEAETENQRDAQRLQQVLILARQASRDTGAKILKGTSGGAALAYNIRSSFCFSSIGVAAVQRADVSRITPIELYKRHGEDARMQWEDLCACWEGTAASNEWCASIRARAIQHARQIARNALTFATACTRYLGAQRDGDQIGALLAGAYALTSGREITLDESNAWCARQDWTVHTPNETDMDEQKCLAHLMGAHIELEESGHRMRRSVGELVTMAINTRNTDQDRRAAKSSLERYGLGIRRDGVDVSNSHQELKRIFADTPFVGKWADQFRRLTGAKDVAGSHFHGALTRAVRLPFGMFERPDED